MDANTVTLLMQLTERAVRAETENAQLRIENTQLKEKIVEITLNPPRRPRKPTVPKVLTPEEEAEKKARLSELAKKAAATRKANKLAAEEAARTQQLTELRALIEHETTEEIAPAAEEDEQF